MAERGSLASGDVVAITGRRESKLPPWKPSQLPVPSIPNLKNLGGNESFM